jgi:hypothetical protein
VPGWPTHSHGHGRQGVVAGFHCMVAPGNCVWHTAWKSIGYLSVTGHGRVNPPSSVPPSCICTRYVHFQLFLAVCAFESLVDRRPVCFPDLGSEEALPLVVMAADVRIHGEVLTGGCSGGARLRRGRLDVRRSATAIGQSRARRDAGRGLIDGRPVIDEVLIYPASPVPGPLAQLACTYMPSPEPGTLAAPL